MVIDEEGHEVPLDPDEARAGREKEKDKGKAQSAPAKGKAPRDRRGRPLREPRKPSWQRAIKMGLLFVAVLFLFTSFVGSSKPSLQSRIMLAIAYGVIGIPFFYWMDSLAYRRWLKAIDRDAQEKKKPR